MATVCPATVSVAVRVSPGFSGTEKLTGPVPVCDVGVLTVTKLPVVETVHAQLAPVLTVKVALPPTPDMLKLVVEIVYVHVGGVAVDGEVGVLFVEHVVSFFNATAATEKRRRAGKFIMRG